MIDDPQSLPLDDDNVTDPEPSSGCGYTGSHFGAFYDDAVCIEGDLWDLDSGDGRILTSGGDKPCPRCNLAGVLATLEEDALHQSLNQGDEPFVIITRALLNPAMRSMHGIEAFVQAGRQGVLNTLWFGGVGADDEGGAYTTETPLARIAWPWPISAHLITSAHDRLAIEEALKDVAPPEGFARTDGMLLGPIGPDDW